MKVLKNPIFENRICEPVPDALYVVPEAVPIPYFGDYDKANICTIGLNPSDTEFYKTGVPKASHPCLRTKLGAKAGSFLSVVNAATVIKHYDSYFKSGSVDPWFTPYEHFLNEKGYSYYKPQEKGLCVHIDLVEWATKVKWSSLPKTIAQTLVSTDSPFFKVLVERLFSGLKPFKAICLDGISVINEFQKCYPSLSLKCIKTPRPKSASKGKTTVNIYRGSLGSTAIIGWNEKLSKVPWLASVIKSI